MNHIKFIEEVEKYYISNTKFTCLSVAIDCNIFEIIYSGASTLSELQESSSFNAKVLKAYIESLTCLGFLSSNGHNIVISEKTKCFYLKDSKYYQGQDILRKKIEPHHTRFKQALINGNPTLEYSGTSLTTMWEKGSIDFESALHFTKLMQTMMAFPAHYHATQNVFNGIDEITDIGGGSGAWALELTSIYPEIIVSILDLPSVIDATKHLHDKELKNNHRIKFIEANFFSKLPSSKNVLLSNILHDWPKERCSTILNNIYDSLPIDGALYINECLLNEDRLGPEFTTLFNLLMAVNHDSQQFTFLELKELLLNSGFATPKVVSTAGNYKLIVSRKT